jgi:hypothetical protein
VRSPHRGGKAARRRWQPCGCQRPLGCRVARCVASSARQRSPLRPDHRMAGLSVSIGWWRAPRIGCRPSFDPSNSRALTATRGTGAHTERRPAPASNVRSHRCPRRRRAASARRAPTPTRSAGDAYTAGYLSAGGRDSRHPVPQPGKQRHVDNRGSHAYAPNAVAPARRGGRHADSPRDDTLL